LNQILSALQPCALPGVYRPNAKRNGAGIVDRARKVVEAEGRMAITCSTLDCESSLLKWLGGEESEQRVHGTAVAGDRLIYRIDASLICAEVLGCMRLGEETATARSRAGT